MSKPFTRSYPSHYEVKRLLHGLLQDGDQLRIARCMGASTSTVSRRFNPNDELQTGIGEMLREMCGISDANQKLFRTVRAYIEANFDSWESPIIGSDLATLVVTADKEGDDVIQTWAAGKSVHEQLEQVTEAMAALRAFMKALQQSEQAREARQ